MPVRRGDHTPERDPGGVGQHGPFRAELASVHGRFAGNLSSARGLDDAPVDGHVRQVQPDDPVVGVQAELLELFEHAGADPLISPGPDRGRRAGAVAGLGVAGTQHQHYEQLVEHDPVRDARAVAPQRVNHGAFGKKGSELVPQGFDQRGWQRSARTPPGDG